MMVMMVMMVMMMVMMVVVIAVAMLNTSEVQTYLGFQHTEIQWIDR